MIVTDLEQLTVKNKPLIYTRVFIELYKQKKYGQIHEIYRIIQMEKWYTPTAKNSHNLDVYCIIEIF